MTHFNDDEKQGKGVDNLESYIDIVASTTDTTLIPELESHTVNFNIYYNIGLLYDNVFKYKHVILDDMYVNVFIYILKQALFFC